MLEVIMKAQMLVQTNRILNQNQKKEEAELTEDQLEAMKIQMKNKISLD